MRGRRASKEMRIVTDWMELCENPDDTSKMEKEVDAIAQFKTLDLRTALPSRQILTGTDKMNKKIRNEGIELHASILLLRSLTAGEISPHPLPTRGILVAMIVYHTQISKLYHIRAIGQT